MNHELRLGCRFYVTSSGSEPVRLWLQGLCKDARAQVGADILAVQRDWPTARRIVRPLGGGLYEVRTTADGNEYRVLFTIVGAAMVLLNGFVKKSQKTPQQELELARSRMKKAEK